MADKKTRGPRLSSEKEGLSWARAELSKDWVGALEKGPRWESAELEKRPSWVMLEGTSKGDFFDHICVIFVVKHLLNLVQTVTSLVRTRC